MWVRMWVRPQDEGNSGEYFLRRHSGRGTSESRLASVLTRVVGEVAGDKKGLSDCYYLVFLIE